MDFRAVFKDLRHHTHPPCVSIILHNAHPSIPNRALQGAIKNAIKKVEEELKKWNSEKDAVTSIRVRLHELLDSHVWDTYAPALGIFIGPTIEKIVRIPFPVRPKIIVDTSFEVRDILYTRNRLFHYYVLSLGWKNTRMWEGYGKYLTEIDVSDAPQGADEYREPLNEIRLKADRSQYEENLMKKYIRDLVHYLDRTNRITHQIPFMIAGDPKFVFLFKEAFPYEEIIVGELSNALDHISSAAELRKIIEPELKSMTETYEENLFTSIKKYIDKQRYVTGLPAAWKVAHEGRGLILIVEKGYRTEGWSSKDQPHILSLQPMKSHDYRHHEDAVDDLIETFLDKKGRVYFASPERMQPFNHILAITRY